MKLLPLREEHLDLVAGWMTAEENTRWLDFGHGRRSLDRMSLKLMIHRPFYCVRLFTADDDDRPIGLVALSDIDREFSTAMIWYVLGDKRFGGRGLTTRAVGRMLDVAFGELGLDQLHAWAVEINRPSIRVLEKNGFRRSGRMRACHRVDGRAYDRVLFDLLAEEHAARAVPQARAATSRRLDPGPP